MEWTISGSWEVNQSSTRTNRHSLSVHHFPHMWGWSLFLFPLSETMTLSRGSCYITISSPCFIAGTTHLSHLRDNHWAITVKIRHQRWTPQVNVHGDVVAKKRFVCCSQSLFGKFVQIYSNNPTFLPHLSSPWYVPLPFLCFLDGT